MHLNKKQAKLHRGRDSVRKGSSVSQAVRKGNGELAKDKIGILLEC